MVLRILRPSCEHEFAGISIGAHHFSFRICSTRVLSDSIGWCRVYGVVSLFPQPTLNSERSRAAFWACMLGLGMEFYQDLRHSQCAGDTRCLEHGPFCDDPIFRPRSEKMEIDYSRKRAAMFFND